MKEYGVIFFSLFLYCLVEELDNFDYQCFCCWVNYYVLCFWEDVMSFSSKIVVWL